MPTINLKAKQKKKKSNRNEVKHLKSIVSYFVFVRLSFVVLSTRSRDSERSHSLARPNEFSLKCKDVANHRRRQRQFRLASATAKAFFFALIYRTIIAIVIMPQDTIDRLNSIDSS